MDAVNMHDFDTGTGSVGDVNDIDFKRISTRLGRGSSLLSHAADRGIPIWAALNNQHQGRPKVRTRNREDWVAEQKRIKKRRQKSKR